MEAQTARKAVLSQTICDVLFFVDESKIAEALYVNHVNSMLVRLDC